MLHDQKTNKNYTIVSVYLCSECEDANKTMSNIHYNQITSRYLQ